MSTWSRGSSSSRLDRVYVPSCLATHIERCTVLSFPTAAGYISDHCPVSIVFDVSSLLQPRGDTWRMDVSLLRDDLALSSLRRSIGVSLTVVPLSHTRWDGIKADCHFLATAAGKMLRRRTTDALNEVVNRIRAVQRGGARTHLMSEYLAVLRDRHQRLLRLSSRTVVEQRLQDRPVDDPEVLRCLRAVRTGGGGPPFIHNVQLADGSFPTIHTT
ncbi:unnamed protein product [Ixodes pacificus]